MEFVARIKTIQRDFEWMRIRFTNVKDNAGKPIRAICTGEIISEYKDLENRFRMTLRQNNVESWVYDIKRHTIIVDEKTFFAANYEVGDEIQNVPESWIERKLCYPEDAEILRRLYRRLENGEKQVVESLRLLDSTVNKYRWKKCIYTVIEDVYKRQWYSFEAGPDTGKSYDFVRNRIFNMRFGFDKRGRLKVTLHFLDGDCEIREQVYDSLRALVPEDKYMEIEED